MGATPHTSPGTPVRAAALARTVTAPNESTEAKMLGACRATLTLTVSFERKSLVIEMSPAAVLVGVRLSRAQCERRIRRQVLRACQHSRIGGRLCLALLAIPHADVEGQRGTAHQDDEEEDRDENRLTALVLHSSRPVIVLDRFPDATTRPRTLIE
jgi:hypothetical protein